MIIMNDEIASKEEKKNTKTQTKTHIKLKKKIHWCNWKMEEYESEQPTIYILICKSSNFWGRKK